MTRPTGKLHVAKKSDKPDPNTIRSPKVTILDAVTKIDIPINRVLDSAKGKLNNVVLIGWDKEGEIYFASSIADGGDVLWLLEKAKQVLLNM